MAPEPAAPPITDIADRARREVDLLGREIGEIELLIQQARTEAARHEQKRAQLADRLHQLPGRAEPSEANEATEQLLGLTRRAAIMEAQVDVLEGKVKILSRFRDSLSRYSAELDRGSTGAPARRPAEPLAEPAPLPASTSRVVQAAQEDLRRDIARAMHDGPAQSLTNIVLQAQIVDRLLDRDPKAVRSELNALVSMVQQTLEATKAFIFDIRPMVLDDLGLVPTLRRVARDRGRRSQVPIEFESLGADRRLPMDVETTLFRIIDEAITGYLSTRPDRIAVRLDWSEQVEARVMARREGPAQPSREEVGDSRDRRTSDGELPAALRAMIEEQRKGALLARATAMALPQATWREIQQRAETIGATADLRDDGRELVVAFGPKK